MGAEIVVQPHRLAVEHHIGNRHPVDGRHDSREAGSDVVEVAGEDPHVIATAVHLNPRAVQLPLHRGRADLGDGVGHARARRRQHRLHRPTDEQRHGAQARFTAGERDAGRLAEIAAVHGGPSDGIGGHARRSYDCIAHEPRQRTLAQLASEQTPEQFGLRTGGAAQQVGE